MTPDEIERLAAKDQPMPDGLTPPQVMLFQTFAALYIRYRLRAIDSNEAKESKQELQYRGSNNSISAIPFVCIQLLLNASKRFFRKEYQQRIKQNYG